ncbi:MAG: AAC(3) family N-acetyltransferase, partial [Fibrobacterota bacterium]
GLVEPTPVSPAEEKRGLNVMGKTIINAFVDAVGKNGTFFLPTHSCNFIGNYSPGNLKVDVQKDAEGKVVSRTVLDDGYYNKAKSESLVGALTQAVIQDDRGLRSEHPSHSIAGIGKEADYLVKGHDYHAQPVGLHNAFTKTVGLDGVILFVGDTLKSNTTFHAYETMLMPKLGPYFAGAVAVESNGLKFLAGQTWSPNLHRDFYDEHKRPTRGITAMRQSGLLHEGKLGRGPVFWFNAKEMARYFAEVVYPQEPDILFCNTPATCTAAYDCGNCTAIIRSLYGKEDGTWDAAKIKADYDTEYVRLMQPGVQRVQY